MNLIEEIRRPIKEEMLLFEKTFVDILKTQNPLLNEVHKYLTQRSGKQLRPMLVLLAAKLTAAINKVTIDAAISLQLLHTASLMHDDVVDDTLERRGKPSVNAKWNNKVAILAGDYMLSKSLQSSTRTGHIEILDVIAGIGMELSDGELIQLATQHPVTTTEDDYLNIVRKKTAFLFAACSQVGSLSVNAPADTTGLLRKFGENLGICFQIKDDIFDYYDDIEIGKPTGNDIRDGKVTLPLIYALRCCGEEERRSISQIIANKDYSDDNIHLINCFARTHGGVEYAIGRMKEFRDQAIGLLAGFPDSEVKHSLMVCAEFAADRDV